MYCPECGSNNPPENRFCGMCGSPLRSQPAADQDAAREPAPVGPTGSRIAGPSFLGLGESPSDTSYLLDDEPRRSRVGIVILLLALLAAGGVFAYQRHYFELPNWLMQRLQAHKPSAAASPPASNTGATAPSVPAVNPPATDASQEQPVPMTQSDQPSEASAPVQPESPTPSQQQAAAKSQAPGPPRQPAVEGDKPASAPATKADAADAEDNSNPDTKAASVPPKKSRAARLRTAREAERKRQADNRMLILGENHLYGRGVAKNCGQALIYLKAAASARNAKAMAHLGAMYATGNCVRLDRPAAYHWFTLAHESDPANPWLESNRLMVWRQMTAAEQDRAARQ